jgi:hypothetical protein
LIIFLLETVFNHIVSVEKMLRQNFKWVRYIRQKQKVKRVFILKQEGKLKRKKTNFPVDLDQYRKIYKDEIFLL